MLLFLNPPEDIDKAIRLATYDWPGYNFNITISDRLCKTTASAQPNLKQYLIFLRLFEGTKNFELLDVAKLADGTYSNLPPANIIKFSHTSAQVTRDSLVDNIVENIENLLKNKVDPANICLGKTTHRVANAIIRLVQKRLAEKNILIKIVDINKFEEDTLALEDNFCFESHRVITYDQNELETFEIQPSSQRNLSINEQKYLIGFPVADDGGEFVDNGKALDRMVERANRFQCNVVKYTKPLFASLNETEKLKSKARKMQPNSDRYQWQGHALSRKLLHSREDETQTADDFYINFVNRYFSRVVLVS